MDLNEFIWMSFIWNEFILNELWFFSCIWEIYVLPPLLWILWWFEYVIVLQMWLLIYELLKVVLWHPLPVYSVVEQVMPLSVSEHQFMFQFQLIPFNSFIYNFW